MIASMHTDTDHDTENDADYALLLNSLPLRLLHGDSPAGEPLFTTSAAGLFDIFLAALPAENRQLHTCRACRQFFDRFGGLARISPQGDVQSAFWHSNDSNGIYRDAIEAVIRAVQSAYATGVFLTTHATWGIRQSGLSPAGQPWQHFSISPSSRYVYTSLVSTPEQAMAEKQQDFEILMRAITEDKLTAARLDQVVDILNNGAIPQPEKAIPAAEWLHNLLRVREATKNHIARLNLTWRAVATAPSGHCRPRTTVIGTLIEGLANHTPIEVLARKYAEQVNPATYQRAQAAPTAGNIAQAEQMIAKLQAAGALARRYARIDELQLIWQPPIRLEPQPNGVFGHLLPKDRQPQTIVNTTITTITWEKFRRTVLPTAAKIELLAQRGPSGYGAMITAEDPSAPPIMQWDSEAERNPISWYVYVKGSSATQWGLTPLHYYEVPGIALLPFMWKDENAFPHQTKGAMLIIKGARDLHSERAGLGLFPSILRAEFHSIRATIEHFSNAGRVSGAELASACGLLLRPGNDSPSATLRVTSNAGTISGYIIDRWD